MKRERSNRSKKESLKCFETTITGGTLKGKKILIPDIKTTRSSKAILRGSLFDTLQFDIIDKNFFEVFAGSGSIGIEALSRGAAHGYFIERNRSVYDLLLSNIQQLGISNSSITRGDSFDEFSILYKAIKHTGVKTYFYFDPPFSTREGMSDIYEKSLGLIEMIEPEICEMVIVEHMTSLKMPQTIGSLALSKHKKFGKSSLSYYHLSES